jgi:hypothetical protein
MLDDAGKLVPVSQITDEHKRKILATNYATIHGIDIEAKKAAIADDEFARQHAAGRTAPPYSTTSIADQITNAPDPHAPAVPA